MNPLNAFLTILAIGAGLIVCGFLYLFWWLCFMSLKGAMKR